MALPFGQTLRLWRLARGFTQAQLAQAASLPQPNLSAIERGGREVSLTTLRALALALTVRPGVLVDGELPPLPGGRTTLSRRALERVAATVVRKRRLRDPAERDLASLLQQVTATRRAPASPRRRTRRRSRRAVEQAWLTLRARYPQRVLSSLLQRIEDRQRVHDATAD